MLFENVKIILPRRYPKSIENNSQNLIFYTLEYWIGDCFNNNFFDCFSNKQLEERYVQNFLGFPKFLR